MPFSESSVRRGNAALALWAALALAVAAGSPITANAEPDAVAVKVRYSELHSEKGARALALRIRVAADKVCGGDDPIVRTGSDFARCRDATMQRAVDRLHAPLLATAAGLTPRDLAGPDR